ncbi:GNAT family N-acetyltransferase [Clostridium sp. WILCCON 0269]|uniref:GNAT family N-acetyltransferase n=1 Tax=Candidatus Clostridium eludens TaxID=3381663 RepID=A0ABW8SKC5_9CLOT
MKEISSNSSKVIIRKAVKSDAKALIEYLNIIGGESDFLTFEMGEFGISIEQEEEFIANALNKQNALFIIAEINEKIIGNLNFSGGPRKRNAHVGESGVSVLKKYWGNGIGKELIKYLIDWSKNSGIIRKLNLRVRNDNIRGICLYKKLGFSEEGILKRDFLVNGKFYDSLLMGLQIDQ